MLQADSDEMYQCWISAMQQGIGAAIQQSISEEGSVVCPSVGNTGSSGGIGGAKDGGASHSPSGSSVGDPVEKPSPERQHKNRWSVFQIMVSWVLTLYILVDGYRCFGGICCLDL